jgi:superfamily II DNA/RNA helicase
MTLAVAIPSLLVRTWIYTPPNRRPADTNRGAPGRLGAVAAAFAGRRRRVSQPLGFAAMNVAAAGREARRTPRRNRARHAAGNARGYRKNARSWSFTDAGARMKMPVRVEVAKAGTVAQKVEQELFIIKKDQKNRLLDKLLSEYQGSVLVFSRTKHGAKRICKAIKNMGHTAAEIHSNLTLPRRRRSLEGFKSKQYRVLVATDIAARGIDVTDIELVINYDLPDSPDDYVHRVGRTGRAGKTGYAISFITPDQRSKIRNIERLVRTSLRISPLPSLPADRPTKDSFFKADDFKRGRRRSHSSHNHRHGKRQNSRSKNQHRAKGKARLHF